MKKALAPTDKRDTVSYLVGEEGGIVSKSCAHLGLAKSSYYECQSSKIKLEELLIEVANRVVSKDGYRGIEQKN